MAKIKFLAIPVEDCDIPGIGPDKAFLAMDTDARMLEKLNVSNKIQLGAKLTDGIDAACDPEVGRKATEESYNEIKRALEGADMVILVACMGDGTGTGATPVIAKIAKELGAFALAIVTMPFGFEGKKHTLQALAGIERLQKNIDSPVVVFPNDKLMEKIPRKITMREGILAVDQMLSQAVQGFLESHIS